MGRHEEALKILHGGTVIPAIPLVLDENRKFNEAGQRTLIRYYLDAGVGGLAVAVHTTQFEIRKPEVGLFEPVLRVTKEEMDAYEARTGKTLVRVAGACGEAEQACAEARTAKALGFDAVLLSPGGLAHRTEEELVELEELLELLPELLEGAAVVSLSLDELRAGNMCLTVNDGKIEFL